MKLFKVLAFQFFNMLSKNIVLFNYPLEAYSSAGSEVVSIKGRVTKLKISHILIIVRGVALIATELPKLILNMSISDGNKNTVINCDLLTLARFTDIMGGSALNSTTDARILIPVGTIDTRDFDLNYQILGSSALAANAMTIDITGHLLTENLPIYVFEKRTLPVAPVFYKNLLKLYDIATAYNSTVKTTLTFENNSQMVVDHKTGFAMAQVQSQIEADNTFGLIYGDKDMYTGRNITVQPGTAYTALTVQLFQ